jgi:hypothetical protein
MTAAGTISSPASRPSGPTGNVVELARYSTASVGERVIRGQGVDGSVRLTDHPARGVGRAFLIERELERDGKTAMHS